VAAEVVLMLRLVLVVDLAVVAVDLRRLQITEEPELLGKVMRAGTISHKLASDLVVEVAVLEQQEQ
jgi:hypothetical protein